MQLVEPPPIDKPTRHRLPLLLLALLLAWQAPAHGATTQRRCIAELFCLETRERDGRLALWLETLTGAELSIAVQLTVPGGKPGSHQRKVESRAPGRRLLMALDLTWPGRPLYAWSVGFHPGTRPARHDPAAVYRLPYAPGTAYEVIQGADGGLSHTGRDRFAIDWRMPEGTPVHAARAGRVTGLFAGSDQGGGAAEARGHDNFLWIEQADGTVGWYAHFRQGGILVEVGQEVAAGQLVGYSGATGYATEPHLHFHVSTPVDDPHEAYRTVPLRFLLEDAAVEAVQAGRRYRSP